MEAPQRREARVRCTYLSIQGSLQLHHVGVLLRVDVLIREENRQTIHCQPSNSLGKGRGVVKDKKLCIHLAKRRLYFIFFLVKICSDHVRTMLINTHQHGGS